ncbi:MAG: hypothetical protein ACI9LV_000471 [Candidatus Nanohaloarchaea archaeon]|jgi:hypothetical protein
MSKGFAYTSFALLSATLLISILFTQVYQPTDIGNANAERIGEASFFLDSLFTDTDRTLNIATRRAFSGAVSEVVTRGEPLKSPQNNITEIMVNGTLDGNEVDSVGNASLSEWKGRVSDIASDSGYSLDISVSNSSFNNSGFEIYSSFDVSARLLDPVTRASFNRSRSTQTVTSIRDLEDPMITVRSQGRYTVTVNECSFEEPAEKVHQSSQNTTDTAYGAAVVRPTDLSTVQSKNDKVLAVEDPDIYSSNELNQFEGVVASETRSDVSSISTVYAFGTDSLSGLGNSSILIDSSDVWRTGFAKMFEENCYVESERAPSFTDRLANNLTGDSEMGITTLINIPELPPQLQKSDASAVDFVYFSDSASDNTRELKEISDQDEYPWFRLDQDTVDQWEIEELVR